MMDGFFLYAAIAAVMMTFAVLLLGLFAMSRKQGGVDSRRRSNRLMRLRVVMQFVAVMTLVAAFLFGS